MHHYIITGSSRGIGEALAMALLKEGNVVHGISRTESQALAQAAREDGGIYHHYPADLSQSFDSIHLMGVVMGNIDPEEVRSICLVNNAGSLGPVSLLGLEDSAEEIAHSMNLNLLTPMLMVREFVMRVQDWEVDKKILNISSGAGRKARAGWTTYCTTKAGIDMYSQCVAADQGAFEHPIKVVALAPGVVDTAMQDQTRLKDESIFPSVDRFRKLKENGQLWSPEFAAEKMLSLLDSKSFGEEILLDLREL